MKDKFKRGEIVIVVHGNRADITQIIEIDSVHSLSSNKFKPTKYKYHTKFGAGEGFYKDGRKIKKLNSWWTDRVKEHFKFN